MEDNKVLDRIKQLVHEEEHLYSKSDLADDEVKRLHQMKFELDQCWDFLRQRQALRNAGENPYDAKVRPPNVVENYEQ